MQHQVPPPVGVDDDRGADGVERVHLVDVLGAQHTYPPSNAAHDTKPVLGTRPLARNCVARVSGGWWSIDPVFGLVHEPLGKWARQEG